MPLKASLIPFLHKLENSPPNITGDFIIHVVAGVMSVTSYTVEDDNGTDHVTLKVCIIILYVTFSD